MMAILQSKFILIESAKLHALTAYVPPLPCVLTYQRALRAYVPACLACLCVHVRRALRAYVFTCQRALHALRTYVLK